MLFYIIYFSLHSIYTYVFKYLYIHIYIRYGVAAVEGAITSTESQPHLKFPLRCMELLRQACPKLLQNS